MAVIYGTPIFLHGNNSVENDILPYVITNFIVANQSTGQAPKINLTWTNPVSVYDEYFAGVKIVRKIGSMPMNTRDGLLVFDGTGNSYIDLDVEYDTDYYYRAFPYNFKNQYQTSLIGQVDHVVSIKGLLLNTIPLQQKIKLGKYKNTALQWQVADHTDNITTLILDPSSVSLIGTMQFDASEPRNSDTNRQKYGNNRYIYSALHQWLNAVSGANAWWTKMHSYDVAPAYASTTPGFLNQWDSEHLALLQNTQWTVTKCSTDGGGSESFNSRIALPSTTEMGLESGTGGIKLGMFNSDTDRSIHLWYWLRTPYTSNSYYDRSVSTSGALGHDSANSSSSVRPLCKISSDLLVSLTTDSDGCYTLVY